MVRRWQKCEVKGSRGQGVKGGEAETRRGKGLGLVAEAHSPPSWLRLWLWPEQGALWPVTAPNREELSDLTLPPPLLCGGLRASLTHHPAWVSSPGS